MGATQSKPINNNEKKSLSWTIDYMAANYILTSHFQDLKNLYDPEYCKNLVVLTSDVIGKYLTNEEIDFLQQRMEGNEEKNIMTKQKVAYFDKNDLNNMDVQSSTKKKRMCIGIAKFYVKVFHVFNAIAHTINPVYTYKDQEGTTVRVDYEHRNSIPKDANPKISKVNLCSARISALINDQRFDGEEVTVKPKFCDLNKGNDVNDKNLQQEPGIPELELLYYDVYDYGEGRFTSMSPESLELYKKDVETFYKAFTKNSKKPDNIEKFGQILLEDYSKIGACSKDGQFRKSFTGSPKEKLFGEYIKNIGTSIEHMNKNQDALLEVIDMLFVFIKDPQDPKKKQIIINPKLTFKSLQKIVDETRKRIIALYTQCEEDFHEGLRIFEAIVEEQIKLTTEKQIKNLEDQVASTIAEEPNN